MKRIHTMIAVASIAAMLMSAPAFAAEKITVSALPGPQAEILASVTPALADMGYDLEVVTAGDYIEPNMMLSSGEADANYFQHIPYLYRFNEENGTELVNAGRIHYEPFGIYPGTKSSLEEISDGDVIAVPNDAVNMARSLLLLRDNGIISLDEEAGLSSAKKDITENPYNVKISPHDAAQVFRMTGEAAYIVLDAKQAVKAGISPASDALALETPDSAGAQAYAGLIAVRKGDENSEKISALVNVLLSEETVSYINDTFDGAVLAFTADQDSVPDIMGEYGSAWDDMAADDEDGEDQDDDGTAGDDGAAGDDADGAGTSDEAKEE